MSRSLSTILFSVFGLVAAPAFAQQPLQSPEQPRQIVPQPQQYAVPATAQPYDQPIPPSPRDVPQYSPPMQDQEGQYDDDDDEEEGYDVTYDVMQPDEQQQDYDDGYDPNAYQQFESQLSPYGTWEDSGTYGRVWVPSPGVVGGDFQPYDTDGYFANTDYGWTWVSNYNWGWAPFHYGRWMVMSGRGWCWMPGTQWGPAWVNWRFGGGYAGWSPMAPRGVSIGAPRGMRGPWRFTTAGQLGAAHPAYLPSRIMPSVWNRTQAVNNVTNVRVGGVGVRINGGPSAAMMTAATGRVVAPVPLRTLAPLALPRATVVAHAGTPMQSRPWMQSRPIGGSFARPASNARWLGASHAMPTMGASYRGYETQQPAYHVPAQTPYRLGGMQPARYAQPMRYAQPVQQYHYAQPVYRSTYAAPTFHVTASPSYSAPRAPTYNAPSAPTYSAPAPAPHGGSFSSGGMSGGFHGGGGHGGGHR